MRAYCLLLSLLILLAVVGFIIGESPDESIRSSSSTSDSSSDANSEATEGDASAEQADAARSEVEIINSDAKEGDGVAEQADAASSEVETTTTPVNSNIDNSNIGISNNEPLLPSEPPIALASTEETAPASAMDNIASSTSSSSTSTSISSSSEEASSINSNSDSNNNNNSNNSNNNSNSNNNNNNNNAIDEGVNTLRMPTITLAAYQDEIKLAMKQCKAEESHESNNIHVSITVGIEWRKKIANAIQQRTVAELSCIDIEYVQQLLFLERSLLSAISNKQKLPKVADVDIDMSYQAIFENFILEDKIFRGKLSSELQTNYLSQLNIDISEFNHLVVEGSRDVPLHRLLSKDAYVNIGSPKIVLNNYLWRILAMSQVATGVSVTEDDHVNILSHWPSVSVIPPAGAFTTAYSCPLNLNQVVWGVDGGRRLDVRVFSRSSSGSLNPILGPSYAVSFNSSLHYVNFEKNGFNDINEIDVKFREVTLSKGEYLYVPHSDLVSFRNDGESAAGFLRACIVDASNLNLFRENLEKYQKISKHYSDLLKVLPTLSFAMSRTTKDSTLFDVFKFDIAASSDFSSSSAAGAGAGAGAAVSGNQAPAAASSEKDKRDRRQRKSNANLKEFQDTSKWNAIVSSLTMQRPSNPVITEITRLGGKVTWTSSFAPNAKDQSVFGFNLTICEVDGRSDDQTSLVVGEVNTQDDIKCQYLLAYRVADKDTPEKNKVLLVEPSINSAAAPTKSYHTIIKSLQHSKQYKIKANTVYTTFQSLDSEWSETFYTKKITVPSPINCFEAVATASKGKGKGSNKNKNNNNIVNDHNRVCFEVKATSATEISISFRPTEDDGGRELLGYFVYALEVVEEESDDMADEDCRIAGSGAGCADKVVPREDNWYPTAFISAKKILSRWEDGHLVHSTIAHLFPNTTYKFAVVAASVLGNSTHSKPSIAVTTQALKDPSSSSSSRPILLGRHHARHSIRDFHNSANIETKNKCVHISDRTQLLTVGDFSDNEKSPVVAETLTFDIWRSYFSPDYVDIDGDCVVIRNYSVKNHYKNLNGRIVMVERDSITPFYKTASALQREGALGAIIFDSGRCKEYDQFCIPFANRHLGEFFGQYDPPRLWRNVRMPVVFALKTVSDFLLDHDNGRKSAICSEYHEEATDSKDEL